MWSHSSPFNNLSDETSSARQTNNSFLKRHILVPTVFIMVAALLGFALYMLLSRYQASKLTSSSPVKTLNEKSTSQASPEILLGAPTPLENRQAFDFNQNKSSTQVKINGQAVPLPDNGVIHKEISNSDGQSSVDISSNSETNGSGRSHSSLSIQVESKGKSDVQVMNSE